MLRKIWQTPSSAIFLFLLAFSSVLFAHQERKIPEKVNLSGAQLIFDSSSFQSNIRTPGGFGALANGLTLFGKGDQAMGFAAKSEEAKTFLIGSFYSETLAYLRARKFDLVIERLRAIEKEFIAMDAPGSLYNFISKIENAVVTKRYEPDVLLEFFSLFQPFYEDYLKSKGQDRLTLFRAGSWLMDMGLAAAAQDKKLLKQPQTLAYFVSEMKRMDAPKGVLDALTEISKISEKKDIGDRDAEQVLKLIKRIQTVLG